MAVTLIRETDPTEGMKGQAAMLADIRIRIGIMLLLAIVSLLGTAQAAASLGVSDAIAQDAAGRSIEGRWINPSKSVLIVIAHCGAALCGTVEWASEKARADAVEGTDALVGSRLLYDVTKVAENRWRGRLFVPDLDERVHAKIRLEAADELKVSGCAIGRSLCRSQLWNRTSEDFSGRR